uniref:Uncharacterized protein n=1 Tax=Populus davidiana TaxID=266767 RepID=A0A6M2F282_9ROSI
MAQDMIGVEKKLCALPKEKMKERTTRKFYWAVFVLIACIILSQHYSTEKRNMSRHYIYFHSPWKVIYVDLWRYIDCFFSLTNNPSITAALGILAKQIVFFASALTSVCYDWISTMV